MKTTKKSYLIGAGLLLVAAAILAGDAGMIPHGLKLFLMGIGVALQLWGVIRLCRTKGGNPEG